MQEELLDDEERAFLASKSLSEKHTLRSEMAQEIISRRPGFLERWALLIFLVLLLLMFGSTWFVHYPDIIMSRAVLTSQNNPQELLIGQEGVLARLLVKNNQPVKKNEVIAYLENTANPQHVINLSRQLDSSLLLLNANPGKVSRMINLGYEDLGEIQQAYDQYLSAIKEMDHQGSRQRIIFQQQALLLKKQVNDWEKKYLIRAAIPGKASLNTTILEGQYLRGGTLLGYVIPDNEQYYAEAVLPQNNFGKIDIGLRVQLRLDAYPYEEWGFIDGSISYISKVPTDNGFFVTIKLNSTETNNKQKLTFRNGLKAQALIVTKDMRLLQRFYYGFVKSTSINK